MKSRIGPVAILLALLLLSTALAEVRDNAGFFSADAVQRADAATQQMRRDLGRELVIETYPAIPTDRAQNYRPESKDQFFEQWGNERSVAVHVDGVYILINRDPAYLFVTAGNKTRQKDFTQDDERELRDAMLSLLKQKQYDAALDKAVEFVPQRIRDNRQRAGSAGGTGTYQAPPLPQGYPSGQAPGPAAPSPGGTKFHFGGLVCFGLFILFVFFILRGIFGRRRFGGYGGPNGGPGYGGYPPGYGGGGFGRGILGGILGGMAGGWLGDKLSGRNNPTYGAPPPPPDSGNAGLGGFNDSGGDTGFSGGAGGSFDNSSGGGGGDSGGSSDGGAGGSF